MLPASSSKDSKRSVSSLSHYSSSGNRPGSSLSIASLARPVSSASVRPVSRASTQRPKSRATTAKLLPLCNSLINSFVGLTAEGDDVVEQEARNHDLVDFAMKNLSIEGTTINKTTSTLDKERIDAMIRGHAEKARIRSRNTFAEALETCYKRLNSRVDKDLDADIKDSRLPAHMQFLLALSQPPQDSTLTYASMYLDGLKNPPPPPESTEWTWKKILEEEPFEGEHWLGVPGGIPIRKRRKSTLGGDTDEESTGSTPSLSSLDTEDELDLDISPPSILGVEGNSHSEHITASHALGDTVGRPVYTTYAYRQEVESLKKKQYWREDWKMDARFEAAMHQRGTFDIGNASTLGPTLQRVLPASTATPDTHGSIQPILPLEVVMSMERYIYEHDAVREILIALQGRKNILFEWQDGQFTTTKSTPRLLHLSLASQQSLLKTISTTCTTLQHLRSFTSFIILHSSRPPPEKTTLSALERNRARKGKITRTLEAFADAVDTEVRALEAWCASKEEIMIRALGGTTDEQDGLVISLLNIEKSLRDTFEDSFDLLLEVVFKMVDKSAPRKWELPNRSPSTSTALLLDTLFSAMQLRLERGDQVTADSIMRVFVRSAEAVWSIVGKWLRSGFELGGVPNTELSKREPELDEEFFIESTGIGFEMGILGLLDPDFWADGYGLRDDEDENGPSKGIPSFLFHVASAVLETGKSVGLLKALDIDIMTFDGGHCAIKNWTWYSFRDLIANDTFADGDGDGDGSLFSVSVDRLSQLIYDYLMPYADVVRSVMARVVIQECDFWFHLNAIQDVYLMRRGDVISDFCDLVFAKMDTQQNWNDFHFLNTAFSDVVELSLNSKSSAGVRPWLHRSLVRFSHRGNGIHEKSIARTVKAIDGLNVDYAVPFPLTYIFSPRNIQVYGEIFVFMLQFRRAKCLLERVLVRGERGRLDASGGLKPFYAIRSRLSWFINTMLNFLVTNVIHTQIQTFHEQLQQTRSLDHIIQLHDEHLKKIQGRFLLQPKTAALYQAIISVLDMALRFSDTFASFSRNTSTHDVSMLSGTLRHRSRRQRRHQKNVVQVFTNAANWKADSSDSESDVDEDLDIENTDVQSFSVIDSTFDEGDYASRINKMSVELDGLVRFVRRGAETLAGGTGEAAAAFGVLAFALEDWDL